MFNNIDLYNPDFYFDCKSLRNSKQVYKIFRDNKITKAYVYAMSYRKSAFTYDFLKVGLSHPALTDREYQVGERVVRQLSHVPGWSTHPISDHGNDFYCGIKRLISQGVLKSDFSKNDLTVGVWDVTGRMNQTTTILLTDDKNATEWAEGELCNQYKRYFGIKPSLNYRDPSNSQSYKKGYIPKNVLENFYGLDIDNNAK